MLANVELRSVPNPVFAMEGTRRLSAGLTDRENRVVLNSSHSKVLYHPFNLCVSDVGSIDVADQVKHRKNGDEPPINLNKA